MKQKHLLLSVIILAASMVLPASAGGTTYVPLSNVVLDFSNHPDVKVDYEDFVLLDQIMQNTSSAYTAGYEAGKKRAGGVQWEYIRHYHKDGAGNHIAAERNSSQGGCFNTPVYHTHSRAAGCYHVVTCESTSWHLETFDVGNNSSYSGGGTRTHWVCDGCGQHGALVSWTSDNGQSGSTGAPRPGKCGRELSCTLICTKSTANPGGYVDYWVPTCGYKEGQVIGVNVTTAGINTLKTIINKESYKSTIKTSLASTGQFDFGNNNYYDSADFENIIARYADHVEADYISGYAAGLKYALKSIAGNEKLAYLYIDGVLVN